MFIDTHIDTLWAMSKENRRFSERSDKGHVDLHRAREAGLLAGFFTGYPTESAYITERMLSNWIQFATTPENKIRRLRTLKDIKKLREDRIQEQVLEKHEIGAILCLEGASGIDTELNRLHIYYEVGLRSMGITWNETNQFATSQLGDANRGFTREGLDLLSRMEDLGIIIDISHLNDKSFWDVINNTNSPIIASHSNLRTIADHQRNLLDDMAQAVADTDGSLGINFYKGFLETDPEKANRSSINLMAKAMIDITGPKHFHLGADLDGATLPDDVKDITDVPSIVDSIKSYVSLDQNDIENIKLGNILRVINKVWK